MGKAQNKLQDNRPESSLEDIDKALEKLEKAKKDLEDEIEAAKRELLNLPFEQLGKKQEQTKIETDRLAEDMEKSEGENQANQGQPTPGKKNVQQAVLTAPGPNSRPMTSSTRSSHTSAALRPDSITAASSSRSSTEVTRRIVPPNWMNWPRGSAKHSSAELEK